LAGSRRKLSDWSASSEAAAPNVETPRHTAANDSRAVAAAIGLSLAGVTPPILVTIFPAIRALIGPPFAADILVALLMLAPAGVGLAAALSGLPRIAASLQRETGDAEQAILRVFADVLLFVCAWGVAPPTPTAGIAAAALPVAALGLVAAWVVLLWVVLKPTALRPRLRCALALDIALLSGLLHLGGAIGAGLFPVYLGIVFYAGHRFGERALLEAAIASLAGFVTVAATTDFWLQQPGLAVGLIAALVFLPASVAGLLRRTAAARAGVSAAEAGRARTLAAIADALRPPLAMMLDGGAEPSTRRLAERITDILELAAAETGEIAVPIESFDLRELVTETLTRLSSMAAEKGIALRWRIDPRLPPCLHGSSQTIARLLVSLAGHLIDLLPAGSVRVTLDTVDREANQVRLRLRIDANGAPDLGEIVSEGLPQESLAATVWQHESLTVGVATRLVALIGGELSIEGGPVRPSRFVVTLALGIEHRAAEADLELHGLPVLIVSDNDAFAGEMAALLDRWHADGRWIGNAETSLAEIARSDPSERSVVIVDGCDRPLPALAFADSVQRLGAGGPFILFVGESSRIERLAEVDEGALDCLLPMPLTERLMANAFRGLPLAATMPIAAAREGGPRFEPAEPDDDASLTREGRVTPIAAHPKFGSDIAAVVDIRAIEALRALGGGEEFLRELIGTFRVDARQLLERLEHAASAGDIAAFGQGLAVLRRCAGHLGGKRLCQLLLSAPAPTRVEMRDRGGPHLQRIAAEIDRLAATLEELLPATAAQRS
jgi:signal transduction histidine kinase